VKSMTKRLGLLVGVAALYLGFFWIGQVFAAETKTAEALTDQKAAAQGSDKEVVIRGESRLRVKVEKPEPDLMFDVDEIAVPYVKTEDYVMDVSPTSIAHPAVNITSYLGSSQTASPFIKIFKRPPIMTLRPRYKSKGNIAKWRLRITDGFGNVFKDFSGKNSLPEELIWDGRGGMNDSEMADVGTSFSYIFSIVDVASNPTSQMGRPIVLESLMYEDNGMTIAKVVSEAIFEKKERRTALSSKGELYCREIADILLVRQSYPMVIECYAKDVEAATSNGEILRDYLTQRYILPKDNFKIVGFKARLEKIVFKIR